MDGDRRRARRVPVALLFASVVVILGLATLFSATTQREKVVGVEDNALHRDLHEKFPFLKHLKCITEPLHLSKAHACMRAYKCCTGPSMNCVPEMSDYYGKQCRSCLELQAPKEIVDDDMRRNFADVCWVEVVDQCRQVCPRHEPSGHLGHEYCLDCLEKNSLKVKKWDVSMADAMHLKLLKRQEESKKHMEQVLAERKEYEKQLNREKDPLKPHTADELRAAVLGESFKEKEKQEEEERTEKLDEHNAAEQKNMEKASEAYNALRKAAKQALLEGEEGAADRMEDEAEVLRKEMNLMKKAVE